MPNPLFHDNLDDRREIWRLLSHPCLTDAARLSMIRTCAASRIPADTLHTTVVDKNGVYTAYMAWLDLLALSFQFRIDLTKSICDMVQYIRKRS